MPLQDGAMATKPTEPTERHPGNGMLERARSALRGGGRVVGIAILAILTLVVVRKIFSPGGYLSFDPIVLLAVALVGAGVLLLRGQDTVAESERVERAPRERSPLGLVTLSALFLVAGLLILLGNLGVVDIGMGEVAAACLFIVGLGLLVGTWWGRSRLLIPVGLLLIPAVAVGNLVDFPLRGSVGSTYQVFHSLAEVPSSYEILVGHVTLDLVEVSDWTGQHSLDLNVAGGRVSIYVPERVGVSVSGDIEWGNATIGKGREEGEELVLTQYLPGKPGAGNLEIDFKGGIASLYIERISHRERFGAPPVEVEEPPSEEPERRRDKRQKSKRRRSREKA